MNKIWKIKKKIKAKEPLKRRQQIIDSLLKDRELTTKKLQKEFFEPLKPSMLKPKNLGLSLTQLKKAITRLKKAIKKNQLIYIYGDFDADGICSTAILWEALNSLHANVMPYIPIRGTKTRGLSKEGIDQIIAQAKTKPDLIITVDNGIVAFKGSQYAKTKKIDVIITDHHEPKTKAKKQVFPKVHAIIHSTKLAGVGVAWVFAQEILKKLSSSSSSSVILSKTLQLAALGTIADMVPLIGANRSLAKFGLDQLRQTKRPGFIALAKLASLNFESLQAYQVSFVLAPRLNAMGRLDQALDSVRLLCTTDSVRAQKLALNLEQTNKNRMSLMTDMLFHARNQWLKRKSTKHLIFVSDQSYHDGIVGLIAGRLMEEFHRPVVIVALGKDQSKASARSIAGFDVIKNFRKIEKLLLELGGHKRAAGFTADNKNLAKIQKKLEKLAQKTLKPDQLTPTLDIDCQIDLIDINWELYDFLEKFRPFGFANRPPIFASKGIELVNFRAVGQDQKHLQLNLKGKTQEYKAIAFNFGHLKDKLQNGQLLDLAYTIDKNVWNNQKTLQLKVKSINQQ